MRPIALSSVKNLWARIAFKWKWWRAPYVVGVDYGHAGGDHTVMLYGKRVDGVTYITGERRRKVEETHGQEKS